MRSAASPKSIRGDAMDLKRTLSAGLKVALSAPSLNAVLLVYLDWPGGAVRVHSGTGIIAWGGFNWNGVGGFGSVDVPEEALSGMPVEFALSLVCELPELATYADAVIRQRAGEVYLGATTEPGGNVLVGAPCSLAAGTMDTLVLASETSDGNTEYRLTLGLATGPGYRSMAAISHSHEDQSRRYPSDTAGRRLILANARAEKTLWPEP